MMQQFLKIIEIKVIFLYVCKWEKVDDLINFCHGSIWVKTWNPTFPYTHWSTEKWLILNYSKKINFFKNPAGHLLVLVLNICHWFWLKGNFLLLCVGRYQAVYSSYGLFILRLAYGKTLCGKCMLILRLHAVALAYTKSWRVSVSYLWHQSVCLLFIG